MTHDDGNEDHQGETDQYELQAAQLVGSLAGGRYRSRGSLARDLYTGLPCDDSAKGLGS